MEHRSNVNISLCKQLAKVNNKMNEKRSQEYQSMDTEYITGQINSRFSVFFWEDFVIWFMHRLKNLDLL